MNKNEYKSMIIVKNLFKIDENPSLSCFTTPNHCFSKFWEPPKSFFFLVELVSAAEAAACKFAAPQQEVGRA